ncbi:MAG: PepSY-associated TM helix domain-containing protein [Prevotellaceae bacterium]|nr:PepSY-associated TM helix domain-containing protein [Prevotellaceae bacterium]
MKRITWRKHHKWLGLCACFFILMFSMSGLVLNHRYLFADINVSRSLLPSRYYYKQWNGGLMRGTLEYVDEHSVKRVIVYGAGGIWITDTAASRIHDFNKGLPAGADYRNIRNVVCTEHNILFAASQYGLYRYGLHGQWAKVNIPNDDEDRLTDITCKDDTLVVASRSFLYVSAFPYKSFKKIQLKAAADYDGSVSLFRTVWLLHSGELFGTIGKLVVDAIAIVLIILCISGFFCWILPIYKRYRRNRHGEHRHGSSRLAMFMGIWHDRVGRWTIVLTLFVAVTGWCLRPLLLIALVKAKTKALSGTTLSSENAWNDRLRMIRYDDAFSDWLLSTADGFYSLRTLDDVPVRIADTPPVSVMGLNVLQKDDSGHWLCGSLSGMYIWDRLHAKSIDYFTHKPAQGKISAPFGKKAISGYSDDFHSKPFAVEYYDGTDAVCQPDRLSKLPMSLWNFALEVHSGRIYIGTIATFVFIFFTGIFIVWCLWSGWKIRRK